MRTISNRRLIAALTGSVLLLLPACSGTDQSARSNAAAPESTPSGTQPSPTQAEDSSAGEDPFALTREAATHMPMTADVLASGFASALKIPGGVESEAAALRAGLSYLLTEHVYLAGIAVDTAYVTSPKSPEFELAAQALDQNSVALADAVGSIAGKDARGTFLQAWRSHIDDFVSYAVAAKSGDGAGMKQALRNLEDYEQVAGKFFQKITEGALPASAVRASLGHHVATLTSAIDAFAAGDTSGFGKLKTAADHMATTAEALAGGIDQATNMKGNPASKASDVRALLNAKLTEHVYLAGVAVFTAYAEGADSKAFQAAAGALDENSVDLGQAVTSLTDKQTGDSFLQSWRSHIDDFVSYAVGVAEEDQAAMDEAQANLRAYAKAQGETMQQLTGGELKADDVQHAFETHAASLSAAIDAMAAALL